MGYATYDEWLASRPPIVRELLTKFPPMTVVQCDDGESCFVIGADEAGNLLVSPVNPHDDYHASLDAHRSICPDHQATLKVIALEKQETPFSHRSKAHNDAIDRELRKMFSLTADEIRLILKTLCPEGGYAKDIAIAKVQAKLSIMLEAAEPHTAGAHDPRR